jgi:hypothetical protein
MTSSVEPSEEQSSKLLSMLKDFTMVVDDMHSFSHEIYSEVVYNKVCIRTVLTKTHIHIPLKPTSYSIKTHLKPT